MIKLGLALFTENKEFGWNNLGNFPIHSIRISLWRIWSYDNFNYYWNCVTLNYYKKSTNCSLLHLTKMDEICSYCSTSGDIFPAKFQTDWSNCSHKFRSFSNELLSQLGFVWVTIYLNFFYKHCRMGIEL